MSVLKNKGLLLYLIATLVTIILFFTTGYAWFLFVAGATAIRTCQIWLEENEPPIPEDDELD